MGGGRKSDWHACLHMYIPLVPAQLGKEDSFCMYREKMMSFLCAVLNQD